MTASALGVPPVHAGLATSKALLKEHAEGVDEPVLKKAAATQTKIRHKAEHQCKMPGQCEQILRRGTRQPGSWPRYRCKFTWHFS